MATSTTSEQRRPAPSTIPATEAIPEITFHNTDIETSYSFNRADGNQVGFALTHSEQLPPDELHLAVLDLADKNYEVVEEVHLSYAEARLLRSYLNRPKVARWLDQQ